MRCERVLFLFLVKKRDFIYLFSLPFLVNNILFTIFFFLNYFQSSKRDPGLPGFWGLNSPFEDLSLLRGLQRVVAFPLSWKRPLSSFPPPFLPFSPFNVKKRKKKKRREEKRKRSSPIEWLLQHTLN